MMIAVYVQEVQRITKQIQMQIALASVLVMQIMMNAEFVMEMIVHVINQLQHLNFLTLMRK